MFAAAAALSLFCLNALSQSYEGLDSLLTQYYAVLEAEDMDAKCAECDWLISECTDSLARQHVALNIYSHYLDSKVMGEEAVAIHIYDNWFAPGKVSFTNDIDKINAAIFADFNRQSLIGMSAPMLVMRKSSGARVALPRAGRTSILFFYDTSCKTCKAETEILPQVIGGIDFPVDLYCIYVGTDKKAWRQFRRERLAFRNPKVRTFHLWDPEVESDFQRKYAVISTPRTYVVEPQGTIFGRRLDPVSLQEILYYARLIQTSDDTR